MKLNSEEWMKKLKPGCRVLDPDGWDRYDFEKSWAEEITEEEFNKRFNRSTVDKMRSKMPDNQAREKIFGPECEHGITLLMTCPICKNSMETQISNQRLVIEELKKELDLWKSGKK